MVDRDPLFERMHRVRRCAYIGLILLLGLSSKAHSATCEDLAKLQLPNTSIDKAEVVTQNSFLQVRNHQPVGDLPPFCRVVATLLPSSDSNIAVEIWLPQTGWNGRLLGTGNGGFGGVIFYDELAAGLRQGYAVVNTDMGLSVPPGRDQAIFVNRPERWIDWGYRSTHVMTLFAKQLVSAYYGREASHSYFLGCSTGGGQAMAEAQRYPEDYDGLVGGAPPNNRTGVHLSILWNFVATHRSPDAYIPQAKALMIEKAVESACGGQDGTTDGIVVDPRKCHFDLATLQCTGSDTENCLTAEQVKTARLLYAGPHNPNTEEQLYPGLTLGSEGDWERSFGTAGAAVRPPFGPIFEWVLGMQRNWLAFDFNKQAAQFVRELGPDVDSLDPDLDKLKESGHKLLIYHGWEDPLVTPEASIDYWNAVTSRMREESGGSHTSTATLKNYFRLFMVPGMYHCGGGPGADSFDPLSAMVSWVENGKAPDQIIATKYESSGAMKFQRPLCPYPEYAKYKGRGDVNKADSFICVSPAATKVNPR